jgi:hypothetical protein
MGIDKAKYNELLMRTWKAIAYMDNPDVSMTDKEKWQPNFIKLLDEVNSMITEDMRPREILYGFDV